MGEWRNPVVFVVEKAGDWVGVSVGSKRMSDPLRAFGEQVEKYGEGWPCVVLFDDRISFGLFSEIDSLAGKAGFQRVWEFAYDADAVPATMWESDFDRGIPFTFKKDGSVAVKKNWSWHGDASVWKDAVVVKISAGKRGPTYQIGRRSTGKTERAAQLLGQQRGRRRWAAFLLDAELPVRSWREAKLLGSEAGFPKARVFVFGDNNRGVRYMSELLFHPGIPYTTRFTPELLPEKKAGSNP